MLNPFLKQWFVLLRFFFLALAVCCWLVKLCWGWGWGVVSVAGANHTVASSCLLVWSVLDSGDL